MWRRWKENEMMACFIFPFWRKVVDAQMVNVREGSMALQCQSQVSASIFSNVEWRQESHWN